MDRPLVEVPPAGANIKVCAEKGCQPVLPVAAKWAHSQGHKGRGLALRDWGYRKALYHNQNPLRGHPPGSLSQGLPAKVSRSGPGPAGAHRKGPEDVL